MKTLNLRTIGTVFTHTSGDYTDLRAKYEHIYLDENGDNFSNDFKMNNKIKDINRDLARLRMPGNELSINKDLSAKSESEQKLGKKIQEFMARNNIEKITIRYVAIYDNNSYEFKSQSAIKSFLKGLNVAKGYK